MHTHEFSEIVIILGGRALRLINVLFRPENLHLEPMDLSGLTGYQKLFSVESLSGKCRMPNRALRLAPKELSIALNYVESLEHELKMRDAGYSFMGHSYFLQIVGYLSRAYGKSEKSDPRARLCVSKAIDYLEAHFDQSVKLDDLSRLTHMSKRSFFRAFQAATGSTPIAYLVNLRLTHAAEMLRRHEDNVTSVAYKVGYNDSNFFARQFHVMFGFPPSDYRKRHELV